jgi:hypothetical protein
MGTNLERAEAVELALRGERRCTVCKIEGRIESFSGEFCSWICIDRAFGLSELKKHHTDTLQIHRLGYEIAERGRCERCGQHHVDGRFGPSGKVYVMCKCGRGFFFDLRKWE